MRWILYVSSLIALQAVALATFCQNSEDCSEGRCCIGIIKDRDWKRHGMCRRNGKSVGMPISGVCRRRGRLGSKCTKNEFRKGKFLRYCDCQEGLICAPKKRKDKCLVVNSTHLCSSSSDCSEKECCIALSVAQIIEEGICKRLSHENENCNDKDAALNYYGGKYLKYCPCMSGNDLSCFSLSLHKKERRKCTVGSSTSMSPISTSSSPNGVSVSKTTIEISTSFDSDTTENSHISETAEPVTTDSGTISPTTAESDAGSSEPNDSDSVSSTASESDSDMENLIHEANT